MKMSWAIPRTKEKIEIARFQFPNWAE